MHRVSRPKTPYKPAPIFRRAAACLAIASLICFTACTSKTPSPSDTEIKSLYARYAESVRKMDVTGYMSFFSSDFAMRSPDGKIHDRAEMEKYQRINALTTKRVSSYSDAIESITRLDDSTFSVIVLQKYDRDQAPMEEPDKPHRIQTSAVQREYWRRSAAGPQIFKIEEILVGPVFVDAKIQE
ncbi:MAG: hypothetical protein ACR2NS_09475 [Gemmatimonadaceae bacterium]